MQPSTEPTNLAQQPTQPLMKLDILKQQQSFITSFLKEAEIRNIQQGEDEHQFVLNSLKQQMHFLRQELGLSTMRDLLDDAQTSDNFIHLLKELTDSISLKFGQRAQIMKESMEQIQQQAQEQINAITKEQKGIKKLKDCIECLENLIGKQDDSYQEAIKDTSDVIKEALANAAIESKQIINQQNEYLPNIRNDLFKQKIQAGQFTVTQEHDLDKGDRTQVILRSLNGAIFIGGDDETLTILHNQNSHQLQFYNYINCGVIINKDFYCNAFNEIKVIDTATFQVKETIHLQDHVYKMLKIPGKQLLCVQRDGYINMIALDTNTVTFKCQISLGKDIRDVICTDKLNEYALAVRFGGVQFIEIQDNSSMNEKDLHLKGEYVQCIQRLDKQQYILYVSHSYKLQFYDREQCQTLKEISIQHQVIDIQMVLGLQQNINSSKVIIWKDQNSMNLIDTSDYSTTKLGDLQYDFDYSCSNSIFQDRDEKGNLRILTLGFNKQTKERKMVEFTIDLQ